MCAESAQQGGARKAKFSALQRAQRNVVQCDRIRSVKPKCGSRRSPCAAWLS
jgi:hypothetical protein